MLPRRRARTRAECLQALESRQLFAALVLDVSDPNAYATHAGIQAPSPATAASGNDDYAALNWLVNTQTASDIVGRVRAKHCRGCERRLAVFFSERAVHDDLHLGCAS